MFFGHLQLLAKKKKKNENALFLDHYCGDRGPNVCWALGLSEEAQWSENRSTVKKMQDFELHK